MKKKHLSLLAIFLGLSIGWFLLQIFLQTWHPTPPNVERFAIYTQNQQLLPQFYATLSQLPASYAPNYPSVDISPSDPRYFLVTQDEAKQADSHLSLAHKRTAEIIKFGKTFSAQNWQEQLGRYQHEIISELNLVDQIKDQYDKDQGFAEITAYVTQEQKDIRYNAKISHVKPNVDPIFTTIQKRIPTKFLNNYNFISFYPHAIVTQREYGNYRVDIQFATSSAYLSSNQKNLPSIFFNNAQIANIQQQEKNGNAVLSTNINFESENDVLSLPKMSPQIDVSISATKLGIPENQKPQLHLQQLSATTAKLTLNNFPLTIEDLVLSTLGSGWQTTQLPATSNNEVILTLTYWPFYLVKKLSSLILISCLAVVIYWFFDIFILKKILNLKKTRIQWCSEKMRDFSFLILQQIRFPALVLGSIGTFMYLTINTSYYTFIPTIVVILWAIALIGYHAQTKVLFLSVTFPLLSLIPILLATDPNAHLITNKIEIIVFLLLVLGLLGKVYELIFHHQYFHNFSGTLRTILSDGKRIVLFFIKVALNFFQICLVFLYSLQKFLFGLRKNLHKHRVNLIALRLHYTQMYLGIMKKIDKMQFPYHHPRIRYVLKIFLRSFMKGVNSLITVIAGLLWILLKCVSGILKILEILIATTETLVKLLSQLFWKIVFVTIATFLRFLFMLILSFFVLLPIWQLLTEYHFFTAYFTVQPYFAFFTHTFMYQLLAAIGFFCFFSVLRNKIHYLFLLLCFFVCISLSQTYIFSQTTEGLRTLPTITLVEPAEATLWKEVTIDGHNFGEAQYEKSFVYLSGVPHRVLKWEDDQVVFLTNPANSQTGDLWLTNEKGQKSNTFRFIYNH